jgi:GxxExxY protein
MPIVSDARPMGMPEDSFKEIAYAVTGAAFALHNEYGRLFSENHYKHQVAVECRKLGFRQVAVEMPIVVTYADFVKKYYVDLLINGEALFELKVASALADEHRAQTLDYLFLTGLGRAKLINLGATSVTHEFVSTTLTVASRKQISIDQQRWNSNGEESTRFRSLLLELLDDWGCFLRLPLYCEAITHFFGGERRVIQEVAVVRQGVEVSRQRVHLLNENMAFKITANASDLDTTEEHLRRFLCHTKLRTLQWVNLHHHDVTFATLTNTK